MEDTILGGVGRQELRAAVRRLMKMGYDNDTGETRLALCLSELQHRTSTDRKRRAADMSRVRDAFEAERRRKRSRSSASTAPRR